MSSGQRNAILIGVAVVALAVAVTLMARSRIAGSTPTQYTVRGICLACQAEAETTQPLAAEPPFVCPKCGKQAVYPWFFCYDCQKRFIPDLVRPRPSEPLRIPSWPSCPCSNCRSTHVGQYDPLLHNPVGDAPLPKWQP